MGEDHGDKDYFTKIVRVAYGERTVLLRWRNKDLKEVDGRIDPDDAFDPRNRPWYKCLTSAPMVQISLIA